MSKQELRTYAEKNQAEYVEFCKIICDEYNNSHVDYLDVNSVLWSRDSMALFFGTMTLMG